MSLERQPPRLIPVLDVMNGQVVRAVGGRRDEYRPVVSRLTGCTDPITMGCSLLAASGSDEIYVADLDAIAGQSPVSKEVLNFLDVCRRPVWVDIGIGPFKTTAVLPNDEHIRPVLGSETCTPDEVLRAVATLTPQQRLAYSLDLRNGELIGKSVGESSAMELARRGIGCGIRALIVLDLARVGTGTGTGTEPLLRAIRDEFPGVDLIAGGGVRTWADVDRLGEAGATGVLVASALHEGTITFPRPAS